MAIYLFKGDKTQLTYSKDEGHRITRLVDNRRVWVPPMVAEELIVLSDMITNKVRFRAVMDRRLARYAS